MNHAKDKSPSPLPGVLSEDLAISSQKWDGLSDSHIVQIHADPILCNSVASTSFCKTHLNHSDKGSIKVSCNIPPTKVDGNSSCQDESSTEVCRLECSAPYSDSTCEDSDEDRPGSFDYMPRQKGHVRIAQTINPSYDEEVKLDSSTASSLIESPRSDDSHAEEKTDLTEAVKETRRKHKHTCWDYMPHCGQKSDDDDEEEDTNDDEEEGNHGGASTRSSVPSSCPRTATKEVDECVSYNLKPPNGPGAGKSNGPGAGQPNGPGTGQSHQLIMPLSYNLHKDRWMSEDSKEKDKKRGRSKDDTDKPDVSAQVDVNGNPRLLDPGNYLQMRQWPRNKLDSTATGSLSGYTPLTISQSHASSGADPNAFDRKKERRRMRLERLKGTPAEDIKGHRKFNDIKEILAFVEGTNPPKGESKLPKKKQERSRKKDHLDGLHSLEETVGGDDAPNKEESFVLTSVQSVPRAMGNSFRRSFDESISKSFSEDEDVDKSNGEFHDCLNTLPVEYVAPNKDGQQKLNGLLVGVEKSSPKEADQFDAFLAEDSKTDRQIADGAGKRSVKSKIKKEKQESVGGNNGHLISKSIVVKRKDSLEIKASSVVPSVSCVESMKSEPASVKDLHVDMKREDSFTEVKKRKKRPGVKDGHTIFPGHFSKSYNNSHFSSGTSNHKIQHRANTPPSQPPLILPGGSQIVILPGGNQTHTMRDLSPSAFPVLSGQGQPLSLRPEARRNSCGDLNSDTLDNRTYDSDRESAKSLPAAHIATASGDILPAYPLSYARIAAAPRKNDQTGNPSLDSSVASIPQNTSVNCSIPLAPGVLPQSASSPAVTPERKTTVWKGSPRERRHSIGSSPKDKVEEVKTSVAEKNRQCGSQEVLSKSTVSSASKGAKHAVMSSSVVKQAHSHENSNSLPHRQTNLQTRAVATVGKVASKFTDSCTPLETKSISQTTGNTNTAASNAGSPEYAMSTSLCRTQDSSAPAALQPLVSSLSGHAPVALEAQKNIATEHIARKSSQASALAPSTQSQTLPSAEVNSKSVDNKNRQNCHTDAVRKNSKKSVIFLDKRFDSSPPQNLGITFGFDSSYESSSDSASQPKSRQPQLPFPSLPTEIASTPSCLPSSSPPPSSSPSCQHFPAPAVSPGHPHIPLAADPAAVVSSTKSLLFTSSPPAQSSDHSKSVPKDQHIHGPCNGLIFSSRPTMRASDDQSQIIRDNNSGGGNSGRSSYSVSYQEIDSLGRTSSSELKSGKIDSLHVTSGIHNSVASRGDTPAVEQQNTSLPHAVIASQHTTRAPQTSSEATLPLTDPAALPRENCGLSLPSAQDKPSQSQGDLELGLREGGQGLSALAKEAGDVVASSETTTALPTTETASPTTETASPTTETASQHDASDSQAVHLWTVPVVYGLKIKSGTGCGKLLFVPSNVSKKSRRNSEEIVSFLKKRWLEEVSQKRGAETFITLNNN